MENSQQFAFPVNNKDQYLKGFTKRELISAMAMQGMLANPELYAHDQFDLKECIEVSIQCADELLKQLNNEK